MIDSDPSIPKNQIRYFEWPSHVPLFTGGASSRERAVRLMASRGAKWWSEHPEEDLSLGSDGYNQIIHGFL